MTCRTTLVLLVSAATAACAARPKEPFLPEERLPPAPASEPAPLVPSDRLPGRAAPADRGPRVARVWADGRLELVGEAPPLSPLLARFAEQVRHARAGAPGSSSPPEEELRAWEELLTALGASAGGPLPPRLELVRAAVTCEAELTAARARYGALPPGLVEAVGARVAFLEAAIERPPAARVARPVAAHLSFPIEPAVVTSFFGPRLDPFDGRSRYHLGVDLQADDGQVVLAAARGRVLSAGWAGGHGNRIELGHDGALVTSYSHLSRLFVQPGTLVSAGQLLGLAGETGRATGPHLHFEVWLDGEPEDPLDLLGDGAPVEVRAAAPQ